MASIAVVGGGVAGLTCAWRLRRVGHDVEVLEREQSPGGRVRIVRHGAFRLISGATEVRSDDLNLRSVLRALSIDDAPALRIGGRAVLRDGRLEVPTRFGFLRSKELTPAARLRLAAGLAFELRRHRQRLDPLRPELAAPLDGESAAAALTRLAGSEAGAAALAPLLALACGAGPGDLSWPAALRVLRAPGDPLAFDAEAFVSGLCSNLRIRSGCEVTSVETETGGARVRYRARGREHSAFADAVVVAVPGDAVPDLCPKLTPAERGFFESLEGRREVIVHLMLERRPPDSGWREIVFPESEGFDLAGVRFDHLRPGAAPAGAGLVSATLTGAAVERMWDASDAAIADLALESLVATPAGTLAPSEFVVHRGTGLAPHAPGSLRRLARFLSRLERSPRLAFAGAPLTGPGVEAAVTTGMRAATDVVRSLPVRGGSA